MSPKEICTKLSLRKVNFYLKSYIFCLHFTLQYIHNTALRYAELCFSFLNQDQPHSPCGSIMRICADKN